MHHTVAGHFTKFISIYLFISRGIVSQGETQDFLQNLCDLLLGHESDSVVKEAARRYPQPSSSGGCYVVGGMKTSRLQPTSRFISETTQDNEDMAMYNGRLVCN